MNKFHPIPLFYSNCLLMNYDTMYGGIALGEVIGVHKSGWMYEEIKTAEVLV
ncbi:hypothetical protein [Lysinibacillus sp. NPDC092081]|uniref:hypothetical protein n=1 Tax=Lysinibacillus sp. NPDC092081 TaxID=3364131 RepID=UPI00380CF765